MSGQRLGILVADVAVPPAAHHHRRLGPGRRRQLAGVGEGKK
jgi:hypothetical protein